MEGELIISQGITLAVIGWLLATQYRHNGCTKRIEQKLDDVKEVLLMHLATKRE